MAKQYRRHLLLRNNRAACGAREPKFLTTEPQRVTCIGCMKTLAMANAELTARSRRNRKN